MENNKSDIIAKFRETCVREDGLMDKYGYDDKGDTCFMAEKIEQFISLAYDSGLQDTYRRVLEELELIQRQRGFNYNVSLCVDVVRSLSKEAGLEGEK